MNLCNYTTGNVIRTATATEYRASLEAARVDGGAGVISVDGESCYVEGEPATITIWESAPYWGECSSEERAALDYAYATECAARLRATFPGADIDHDIATDTDGDRRVRGADVADVAAVLEAAYEAVCGYSDEQVEALIAEVL